jgi:heptosyltransferase-2
LLRKAREVRGYGFRIAVSPHKSLRTALLLALATIPCRIGFRQSAGWFLYHRRVRRDAALHEVDRNLSLLRALGLDPEESGRTIRLEVSPGAEREGETLLSSLGIQKDETVFGIHPGSVWPTKRWSLEGYAELMARLKQKYSCRILLFGGPEDQEFTDRLQRLSGNLGVCLAGKIGLAELPWAIGRCRVFITNDSGPMHMAVARGVPVVAIFCATTVSLGFYPYAANAVVVEKDLACRPCGTHGGRRCPLGTEDCIRLIGPDDVLRGVEMVLEGAATAEPPGLAPRPRRMRV